MAPTCTCVKVLPKTYCAWPMSKKGKQACTCGVSCNQRHALQHSLLRSPARELRPTLHCAGPTRQGDDTTCPELEKRGQKTRKSPTRQGGVVHPVLCCVWSAALLWHCWHTWYSTNLCEFANVGQVFVRWSLVPSGVAKKRVGAPPACSRSARVVCEGRRLDAAVCRLQACCLLTCKDLGLNGGAVTCVPCEGSGTTPLSLPLGGRAHFESTTSRTPTLQ